MSLWAGSIREFRVLLYWQMLYLGGRIGGPYDGSDTYGIN
jgi:hypothetical protein